MTPIVVYADLVGGVSLPNGPVALDALLMSAVALRDQYPPPGFGPLREIEIPIAKEPDGRFHLASFSLASGWDLHERRYVQRRFPVAEAQVLGNGKLRRINIAAGAQKSYRLPGELSHPQDDRLTWYCVGEPAEIMDLLLLVTHLGKRRAVGRGKVAGWIVAPCTRWGDGFPVVRDGRALRTLPADWPGLVDPMIGYKVLSPPYWEHAREQMCAIAEGLA